MLGTLNLQTHQTVRRQFAKRLQMCAFQTVVKQHEQLFDILATWPDIRRINLNT